jgi:hypothetical protein
VGEEDVVDEPVERHVGRHPERLEHDHERA